MAVLGGVAVSYERGTPVRRTPDLAGEVVARDHAPHAVVVVQHWQVPQRHLFGAQGLVSTQGPSNLIRKSIVKIRLTFGDTCTQNRSKKALTAPVTDSG